MCTIDGKERIGVSIHDNIMEMVGRTPMVRLRTGIPANGPRVYAKLEFHNPTGSVKDRMALYILQKAIAQGRLKKGDTVIDHTSGNTGTAVAMAASVLGLHAILTTPEKTSKEKVNLMRSFGAEVIITPTDAKYNDPNSSHSVAVALAQEHGYFHLNQYDNPDNVEAHYKLTGPEIWNDTQGKITHFVAGIGTGGTLSGTAKYLKEINPNIQTIAVDPEGSIFTPYIKDKRIVTPGTYKVEGIGSEVITKSLLVEYIDDVITVADKDSFHRAREIARSEGISAGGSSGAVAIAMAKLAQTLKPEHLIVGIFADGGIRYLTKCYNDEWMSDNGFLPSKEKITL